MDQNQLTNPVSFHGRGGEFFGIWIVNILLSIVTLGIYSAWAKVRTKRYFYGNTHISGDNFEYHAKPIQILKGRIVALVVVLIWSVSSQFFPVASMALLLAFYAALPWLLWSNARFDSAMTSYRNVHFSFTAPLKSAYVTLLGRGVGALLILAVYIGISIAVGSVSTAAGIAMWFGLFAVMAVVYAWVVAGAHRFFANGYQYGDWKFSAEITTGFFLKTYCKAMIIGVLSALAFAVVAMLVVFGGVEFSQLHLSDLSQVGQSAGAFAGVVIVYAAMIVLTIALTAYTTTRVRNYVFSQLVAQQEDQSETAFRFASTMSVSSYMGLVISNFLLQVITLGLARPWVMVRTSRYLSERTAVVGNMTLLVAVDQDSDVKSAVTDEVAQAFDLGIGIN
ncbi:YjgN family protein [Vibrio sp. MarTm2]|uniref:YjgN family protein n=1 Tax=Vibrio sp. MarTm2 TaxID=2998831 RepID=UPI0022CD5AB4|nr:YjgN family protein [Vibrio sp. MarTm2]MDA0128958.1 YjgN family protein [Vibrio sp. MarTm2]